MTTVTSIISIRSFEGESLEFHQALNLYSDGVHYQAHTDSREIIYWMNNASRHPYAKLYFCGLYLGIELIGYTQFAYFQRERLIHIDYLVVAKDKRPAKRFNVFAEQLENFIRAERLDFTLVTAEISLVEEQEGRDGYATKLLRLFRWAGLSELKVQYFQPMLGWGRKDTAVPARLMVASPGGITRLNIDRYLEVLTTLYFKHYQAWYRPIYPENDVEYGIYLTQLLSDSKKKLESVKYLEVESSEQEWGSDIGQHLVTNRPSTFMFILQLVASALAAIFLNLVLYHKAAWNPFLCAGAAICFFTLCAILARFSSGGKLEAIKWIMALARDLFNH